MKLNFNTDLLEIAQDGYLDTTKKDSIMKFKHNINLLLDKAKKDKKIDKFVIIRDDNFFPYDWEWTIFSKNTYYEKVIFPLSHELREKYALKRANVKSEVNGMAIPLTNSSINSLISETDKDMGSINMPVRFRSTKHFTINTPLSFTGNYNLVDINRDFTIIDGIDNFLNSGYAYSVAYHDAYLDVSHEGLPISNDAIVLINEGKFQTLMQNTEVKEQLSKRKVIVYKGEEALAINMVLSQIGVLPSKVGREYADFDNEINEILDESIKFLALNNNLYYNKSHGGVNGHFTSSLDDKNQDYEKGINEFLIYLKTQFSDYSNTISRKSLEDVYFSNKLIQQVGIDNLISAIDEYNISKEKEIKERFLKYKKDRKTISPDLSNLFKKMVRFINKFYDKDELSNYEFTDRKFIEDCIKDFFQESTVVDQVRALKKLGDFLQKKGKLDEMFSNELEDLEKAKVF